jgi:hypothetical protein
MIAVLAGRRIDAADAQTPRFPASNEALVEQRIRDLLTWQGATALVASAACGADLIAHRVARSLGLARVMIMPYSADVFRQTSVVDRPGNWGELFDDLVGDARVNPGCEVIELNLSTDSNASQTVFSRTNDALLDRANELATQTPSDSVLAVVVWNLKSRGTDDLTAAFLAGAEQRGFAVEQVSTLG